MEGQWKAVEGRGRPWKAVEGRGRPWKAVASRSSGEMHTFGLCCVKEIIIASRSAVPAGLGTTEANEWKQLVLSILWAAAASESITSCPGGPH